jgi:hypothetical protein
MPNRERSAPDRSDTALPGIDKISKGTIPPLLHIVRKETGREFLILSVIGNTLATKPGLITGRVGTVAGCHVLLDVGAFLLHFRIIHKPCASLNA